MKKYKSAELSEKQVINLLKKHKDWKEVNNINLLGKTMKCIQCDMEVHIFGLIKKNRETIYILQIEDTNFTCEEKLCNDIIL